MPDNFRWPYAAVGFSDFWTRWHISLSTWLRDYLYIPLGGNRIGPVRTYVNLMLTMLIGGLWHGASWTFVVWGGLHGAYLVGERALKRAGVHGPPLVGAAVTFALVCIAWVFFRATSFGQAFAVLEAMFGIGTGPRVLPIVDYELVVPAVAAILGVHWLMRERGIEDVVERTPWLVRSAALAVMIAAIVLAQGKDRAFIYFQF
jgi:D-alanyl-lipoteichoic acid acyltransferase DltB (MBOAT superfamily)